MEIAYQYAVQCRHNTINGITPSNTKMLDSPGYKKVIEIGKKYIEDIGLNAFSENFQGDQYFVALWTAHIIIEYSNPDLDLKTQCFNIIKEYSQNPLRPDVAKEEQEWLRKNCAI